MAQSTDGIGVEITGDASGLQPATQKAAAEIEALENPVDALNKSVATATDNIVKNLNELAAAARNAGKDLKASLGTDIESPKTPKTPSLKPLTDDAKAAGESLALTSHQMKMLAIQTPDVVQGLLSGQSAFQILVQQGGQMVQIMGMGPQGMGGVLKMLTSPLALTIAGVGGLAAAAGFLAVEMHKGAEEQIQFNNAILLTGGYVGRTQGQLSDMADHIGADMGKSAASIRDVELQLVRTGKVGGVSIEEMTAVTALYAKATGKDAAAASAKFIGLMGDTTGTAIALNNEMHFLTGEQLRSVEAMQRQGDTAGAAKVVMDALLPTLQSQEENLGFLEKAWRGVGLGISAAIDAMARWGQTADTSDGGKVDAQVSALTKQKEALEKTYKNESGGIGKFAAMGTYGAGYDAHMAQTKTNIDLVSAKLNAWKATQDTIAKSGEQIAKDKKTDADAAAIVLARESAITRMMGEQATLKRAIDAGGPRTAEYQKTYDDLGKQIKAAQDRLASVKHTTGPSDASLWEEELQRKKVASDNYFADETQMELDFWRGKLALTTTGTRDWLAVQAKIYQAEKSLAVSAYNDQIAEDKRRIAAASNNWTEQGAEYDQYLADVRAKYGEDTKQYQDALREKETATRQHLQTLAQLQADAISKQSRLQIQAVRDQQSALESVMSSRSEYAQTAAPNRSQKLAVQREEVNARYALEAEAARRIQDLQMQSIDQQLAIADLPEKQIQSLNQQKLELQQQFNEQSLALEAQHQAALAQVAVQNFQRTSQRYHGYVDGIVSAWGQGMSGMIMGTQTFQGAVLAVGEAILNTFLGVIEQMVTNWIVGELTKKEATTATVALQQAANSANAVSSIGMSSLVALADINNSAARAGAAAFAATAAIPIIGPELAPAAAIAADAAAFSFAGQIVASASRGYDIPAGVNPVVQAHAEEMILPADIAQPLRSAAKSGFTGGDQSGGSRGGGDTYHLYQQPGESLDRLAERLKQLKKTNRLGFIG